MAATASSKDHCTVGRPAEGRSHCAQKLKSSFIRDSFASSHALGAR
jgi:hypothetical protein